MWILLFPDDLIALRVTDLRPEFSRLIPVRSGNPQEVWDAFCGEWVAVPSQPKCIQKDKGEEW